MDGPRDLSVSSGSDFSEGRIYVLHCFTKTTNQTAQSDIKTARDRLRALTQEIAERKKETTRRAKGKTNVAKTMQGNVFQQLGFSADESVALRMRAELHSSIVEVIKRRDYTQVQAVATERSRMPFGEHRYQEFFEHLHR